MPSIKILNREYQIACGPGEEEKLLDLASKLNKRLSDNSRVFKGANDMMLMLLTAITLEDKIQDLEQQNKFSNPIDISANQDIISASDRIDMLAKKLEII